MIIRGDLVTTVEDKLEWGFNRAPALPPLTPEELIAKAIEAAREVGIEAVVTEDHGYCTLKGTEYISEPDQKGELGRFDPAFRSRAGKYFFGIAYFSFDPEKRKEFFRALEEVGFALLPYSLMHPAPPLFLTSDELRLMEREDLKVYLSQPTAAEATGASGSVRL